MSRKRILLQIEGSLSWIEIPAGSPLNLTCVATGEQLEKRSESPILSWTLDNALVENIFEKWKVNRTPEGIDVVHILYLLFKYRVNEYHRGEVLKSHLTLLSMESQDSGHFRCKSKAFDEQSSSVEVFVNTDEGIYIPLVKSISIPQKNILFALSGSSKIQRYFGSGQVEEEDEDIILTSSSSSVASDRKVIVLALTAISFILTTNIFLFFHSILGTKRKKAKTQILLT